MVEEASDIQISDQQAAGRTAHAFIGPVCKEESECR